MSQAAASVEASNQSIYVEVTDWPEPIHTVRVRDPLLQPCVQRRFPLNLCSYLLEVFRCLPSR
ncbi:uncharacterized protein EKO05_0004503 [Ascochyta rabiei]|nr:uncharacterized protein EKO05_0004503 [Ascochyta rabiei]UPX14010.1 hypothetical protein EKO05_0004503 [Ascochyta rabiei]